MFKRTAVPPVGPSEHQARQPLNMALDFVGQILVTPRIYARAMINRVLELGGPRGEGGRASGWATR